MLHSLQVKNLAIVENAALELGAGLNVMTGETGAGKSIVVGALGLVLGERADRTMIRAGEDKCTVEAVFELAPSAPLHTLLDDLDLPACEDGRLIVRRVINSSGTGRQFVNDSPTTLQALKQIGDRLVDMHGPHDHQSLLNPDFQRDLLDAYGAHDAARTAYRTAYDQLVEHRNELRALEGDDGQTAAQLDMLTFQVEEIEKAGLTEADDGDLEQEHAIVAHAQRILELTGGVVQTLTEQEGSVFDNLVTVRRAIGELAGIMPEAKKWEEEAESMVVQVQELAGDIGRRAQDVEADPGRLQWLEDRMALVQRLKRKYGASIADILAFLAKAREKRQSLSSRGERIERLQADVVASLAAVETAGRALREARRRAADRLKQAITREIRDLGFAHGSFAVTLANAEPGPGGMDTVEFEFAPNVGEPMRALRVIASSGEISRIMLAVKTVLADHDRIPVLVFDEVDANVGGEMGQAIGSKLHAVARKRQVLCITHLPQVAAHGAQHLVVSKQVRDGRTHTEVRAVEGEARAEEIARMLGGRDITSVVLRHARELLEHQTSLRTRTRT